MQNSNQYWSFVHGLKVTVVRGINFMNFNLLLPLFHRSTQHRTHWRQQKLQSINAHIITGNLQASTHKH
ncbi:MAG TPA: hypothetical protein VFY41_08985 [Nitrososphaeraceae archaeon]|nr:hypothetical protein [Nitrososphaeraceae archaeon]